MRDSFEYQINLVQKGRVSRHLLQPREHRHALVVACEPPAAERILWSQRPEYNPKARATLPRSRFEENTRTHFVLTNTKHFVRYLVADKQGLAFINHTSIENEIWVQPNTLASVHAIEGAYDKRVVSFTAQPGTVFLTVRATGYKFDSQLAKKGGLFSG